MIFKKYFKIIYRKASLRLNKFWITRSWLSIFL